MVLSPVQSCPSSLSHHHRAPLLLYLQDAAPKSWARDHCRNGPGNLWTGTEGLPAPSIYLIVILWPLKSRSSPLLLHTLVKPLGFLSGTQSEHHSSSEEHTVIREPWDMPSAPATAIISVLGSSLTSPSWRDESLCLNGFLERVGIFETSTFSPDSLSKHWFWGANGPEVKSLGCFYAGLFQFQAPTW